MHEVTYSRVKFSLPKPLNSSKYVGTTDDVENAWMDIAYRTSLSPFLPFPLYPHTNSTTTSTTNRPTVPDQMVPLTSFPLLHAPPTAMPVTHPLTGQPGYRVGLEVFHQLHCLNLLRMSTYPEHYTKLWWSDTNDSTENVRGHLDHCIEILRMNLMCMADVNVFTFHPVEGREGFWPDYETEHVCRNFEHIQQWARDNAVEDADV